MKRILLIAVLAVGLTQPAFSQTMEPVPYPLHINLSIPPKWDNDLPRIALPVDPQWKERAWPFNLLDKMKGDPYSTKPKVSATLCEMNVTAGAHTETEYLEDKAVLDQVQSLMQTEIVQEHTISASTLMDAGLCLRYQRKTY